MTRKKAIIAAAGIVAVVAAIVSKLLFFPSVKDAYFAMNYRSLQQVPAGLMLLRPTHYPFLKHADPMYSPSPHSRTNFWIMGRNAPLRDLIAVAYGEHPSRVVVPSLSPKYNFDFLVTVDRNPQERLQAAIREKLGYRAQKEVREVEVLALKVVNPALPGMKVSEPGSRRFANMDGTKVQFRNLPAGVVAQALNQFFNLSIVDKTGLTGSYDYSLPIGPAIQRPATNDATTRATAEAMVKELGLGLVSEMVPDAVLVVKTKSAVAPVLPDKRWRLLGPLNPGAEDGCDHWYDGESGTGSVLTDNSDPAAGENDFTLANASTNRAHQAHWQSEQFSLGAATNAAQPIRFSFDYKLPEGVNEGDNIRVQLRFYDKAKNFLDQKEFWVGSSSHDSTMTSYKTMTSEGISPPSAAVAADVTMSANMYDGDNWSSGTARFDNIFVSVQK